ncbi:MAG TPA: serine/threonine-protein kinase [Polyangiaceae bacterium]|nr:serine/threonine-protein kinase [Polyangiaceae bacterium]
MEAPVQPGATVAGKYRVDRVLGVGGMGVVVAAHDALLDRRVAIKFLSDAGAQNPEAVARFAREARSAARIESEHVARVIEVGTLESGAPYMVMEYLDGTDLSRRVSEQGPLPVAEAVDYVLQACEAIAEAHALGIIHRDLKPANLFLTRRADGSTFVKVLDFGISKAAANTSSSAPELSLTKTAAVMGSPLYMAPEQMRSTRQVDARTDIWAIGVILHELVSGKMPFEASAMPELCAMVLTEPPTPLRTDCPHAPPALAAVVERCLEKEPAQRFANLAELTQTLVALAPPSSRSSAERVLRVLSAAGIEAARPAPLQDSATDLGRPGASTNAAWSPSAPPKHAVTGVRAAAIGGVLLVGVAAAFVVRSRKIEPEATPSHDASVTAQASLASPPPPSAETPSTTAEAPSSAALAPPAAPSSTGPGVEPVVSSTSVAATEPPKPPEPRAPAPHGRGSKPGKPTPQATSTAAAPPPAPPEAPKKRNPLELILK